MEDMTDFILTYGSISTSMSSGKTSRWAFLLGWAFKIVGSFEAFAELSILLFTVFSHFILPFGVTLHETSCLCKML